MRGLVGAIILVTSGGAAAQQASPVTEWRVMNGAEIIEALTDSTVVYGAQWQDFRSSGRTLYFSGRDSWGYWAVREDQYCSQWPPSDLWACYEMQTDGVKIRFVEEQGDFTEGVFKD